jgi:hypothetical protein
MELKVGDVVASRGIDAAVVADIHDQKTSAVVVDLLGGSEGCAYAWTHPLECLWRLPLASTTLTAEELAEMAAAVPMDSSGGVLVDIPARLR